MPMPEDLHFYAENYESLAEFHLSTGKKVFIGDKKDRRCRFCGKSKPLASFRKTAHALPEFLGNKSLVAMDEYDDCNEWFSENLEDHFAKYLAPIRTACQIRGKTGIPTCKSKDGRTRFEWKSARLSITTDAGSPATERREDTKQFIVRIERQPYIPLAIYKCLTKMAISIMPAELVPEYKDVVGWIKPDLAVGRRLQFSPALCLQTFIPGPMPIKGVHAMLLRKKKTECVSPHLFFLVAFANQAFQVTIPSPQHDKMLRGKKVTLRFFPIADSPDSPFGNSQRSILDMSSDTVVRGEICTVSFHYDSVLKGEALPDGHSQ